MGQVKSWADLPEKASFYWLAGWAVCLLHHQYNCACLGEKWQRSKVHKMLPPPGCPGQGFSPQAGQAASRVRVLQPPSRYVSLPLSHSMHLIKGVEPLHLVSAEHPRPNLHGYREPLYRPCTTAQNTSHNTNSIKISQQVHLQAFSSSHSSKCVEQEMVLCGRLVTLDLPHLPII